MPPAIGRSDYDYGNWDKRSPTPCVFLVYYPWMVGKEQIVVVPALLIAGDRDLVLAFRGMDQVISNLSKSVPKLQTTLILPGCGHWTQQERPLEVYEAIIEFLQRL